MERQLAANDRPVPKASVAPSGSPSPYFEEAAQSSRTAPTDAERRSLSGVVVNADGTPVANVAVYASREVFGASVRATNPEAIDGGAVTRNDGTFQIEDLPEGTYQLRAQSIDGEGRQDNVPAGGEAVIELQPTFALRGKVVERKGLPATRFTISVYLGEPRADVSYDDAVAQVEGPALLVKPVFDVAGRFEVAGLRAGAYEVVASTPDERSGRAATMLTNSKRQAELEIELSNPITLKGHIRDYDTDAPVVDCRVEALFGERQTTTISQADGSFKLAGPAPGQTVRLQFSASNYINDGHTATATGDGGADVGTIKLIRGRWSGRPPRLLDWVLEGRIDATRVVAVRPGSEVERAGVVPGAALLAVGANDAHQLGPMSVEYLSSRLGDVLSFEMRLPNGSIGVFRFP